MDRHRTRLRTELASVARDLTADWRRWSQGEKSVALATAALLGALPAALWSGFLPV